MGLLKGRDCSQSETPGRCEVSTSLHALYVLCGEEMERLFVCRPESPSVAVMDIGHQSLCVLR